jgi:hypothetical protein
MKFVSVRIAGMLVSLLCAGGIALPSQAHAVSAQRAGQVALNSVRPASQTEMHRVRGSNGVLCSADLGFVNSVSWPLGLDAHRIVQVTWWDNAHTLKDVWNVKVAGTDAWPYPTVLSHTGPFWYSENGHIISTACFA